jgi:hypothetical protein
LTCDIVSSLVKVRCQSESEVLYAHVRRQILKESS